MARASRRALDAGSAPGRVHHGLAAARAQIGGKEGLLQLVQGGLVDRGPVRRVSIFSIRLSRSCAGHPGVGKRKPGACRGRLGGHLRGRLHPDRDHLGDAFFLHGDPVEEIRRLHGALVVSDGDELGLVSAIFFEEACEALHVGVVERGVHFVQDAEGAGVARKERQRSEEGRQGALRRRKAAKAP